MSLTRRELIYGLSASALTVSAGVGCSKTATGAASQVRPKKQAPAGFNVVLHGLFLLDFRSAAGLDIYSPDCHSCQPPHAYRAGVSKDKLLTSVPGFYQPTWTLDSPPSPPSGLESKLPIYSNFKDKVKPGALLLRLPFPANIDPLRSAKNPRNLPPGLKNSTVFPLALRLNYPKPPDGPLFGDPNYDPQLEYHLYAEPACSMSDAMATEHAKESWTRLLGMIGSPGDLSSSVPISDKADPSTDPEIMSLAELMGSPSCGGQGGETPEGTELPTCIPFGMQ